MSDDFEIDLDADELEFPPSEVIAALITSDEVESGTIICLTPKRHFESNGYMFDMSFSVTGTPFDEDESLQEGQWESPHESHVETVTMLCNAGIQMNVAFQTFMDECG